MGRRRVSLERLDAKCGKRVGRKALDLGRRRWVPISGCGVLGQVAVRLWAPGSLSGKGQRIAEDAGGGVGAETKHQSP